MSIAVLIATGFLLGGFVLFLCLLRDALRGDQ